MNFEWTEQLHKLFRVRLPESTFKIQKGIYHFRREAQGNITRFHLRVEEDGTGLLLANSAVAARLSPTGVLIAKALLEGMGPEKIKETIHNHYRDVRDDEVDGDIQKLKNFIETLANPEDNYPIFNLDDPSVSTPRELFAPFHAQIPVGDPDQINPILQKLWDSGVIHVTFAAVSESSVAHAVRNVERAEDIGMISGLRATGTWLQTPDLLRDAAQAGVDYITVPLLSSDDAIHDRFFGNGDFDNALKTIRDCRQLEVCPVVEIALIHENFEGIESLLHLLQENGVRNVLYYAIAGQQDSSSLSPLEVIHIAALVDQLAHQSDVRYVWQPPVSSARSTKELLMNGPRTAGDVSIRVEADGSVYPARGPMTAAGNLLRDSWESIWENPVFLRYRKRVESPTRCDVCPGLEICAADCPGNPEGWATE